MDINKTTKISEEKRRGGKKKKKKRRNKKLSGKASRFSSDDEDDDDDDNSDGGSYNKNAGFNERGHQAVGRGKMSFKDRRLLRLKENETKRRSKMKCRLCGKPGHVRRECPGIEDGGRGESRYKTRGGVGTGGAQLKKSKRKKGAGARGSKVPSASKRLQFAFPSTFDSISADTFGESPESFPLIDSSTDVAATLSCLANFSEGKALRKDSALIAAYKSLVGSQSLPNYAACISRVLLTEDSLSWPHHREGNIVTRAEERAWFVVGIDIKKTANEGNYYIGEENIGRHGSDETTTSDDTWCTAATACLKDAWSDKRVVGFFVKLDFSDAGARRDLQIQHLAMMMKTAISLGAPLQVHICSPQTKTHTGAGVPSRSDDGSGSPYTEALKVFAAAMIKHGANARVHLTSWAGSCENMAKIIAAFPNLMIGVNGRISFTKSVELHRCVYDIPLEKCLMESGSPLLVPSQAAEILGRKAVNHSGLIPFVAAAIALRKQTKASACVTGSSAISPVLVARVCSENALQMYPRLGTSLGWETNNGGKLNQVASSTIDDSIPLRLLVMRHGESTYNVMHAETGLDPLLFDAPLTEKGRSQCVAAREQLSLLKATPDLVITSPLQRALETTMIVFPNRNKANTLCWRDLSERMEASCDMGSTKSELLSLKGPLGKWLREDKVNLDDIPQGDEPWWYVDPEALEEMKSKGRTGSVINGACSNGSGSFAPSAKEVRRFFEERGMLEESEEHTAKRVRNVFERLKSKVQTLTSPSGEKPVTVLLVGHANLFHEMLKQEMEKDYWMENAEIVTCITK